MNQQIELPFAVTTNGKSISISQRDSSVVLGARGAESLIEMLSVFLNQSKIDLTEERLPSASEVAQGSSYLFGKSPEAMSDNFDELSFYGEKDG